MAKTDSTPAAARLLQPAFYQRPDVVQIARELIGKELWVTGRDGHFTRSRITETEAYQGAHDRACHAYGYRRTTRTEVMFAPGGVAYVYLCYGIHHLLNVVTHTEGEPEAVLIRAVEPVAGTETMLARRAMPKLHPRMCSGPGALTLALGITVSTHNGLPLTEAQFGIFDVGDTVSDSDLQIGTRVGVGYAGADAVLPYRFRRKNTEWVSRAKGVGEA